MPEDPEEIKIKAIKRNQQIHEIQNYMEKQDALDLEAPGKLGAHQVTRVPTEKESGVVNLALNTLRGKSRDG